MTARLILKKAYSDFETFSDILIQTLYGFKLTLLQREVCKVMQYAPERNIAILGGRGLAKSMLAEFYTVWCLWRHPSWYVKYWADTSDSATAAVESINHIIRNPALAFLSHLVPTGDVKNKANEFNVSGHDGSKHPSVKAQGILSGITGGRGHIVISDDIETVANTDSVSNLNKIQDRFGEASLILVPNSEEGLPPYDQTRILVIGTMHSLTGLYTKLPAQGYGVYVFPLDVPDEEQQQAMQSFYSAGVKALMEGKPPNTPLDRFTVQELFEKRLALGARKYDLQVRCYFMCGKDDNYPFDIEDLLIVPFDHRSAPGRITWERREDTYREDLQILNCGHQGSCFRAPSSIQGLSEPYSRVIMYLDTSAGVGRDETAWIIAGERNGKIVVLDISGHNTPNTEEQLMTMIDRCFEFGVSVLHIESNFGGGFLQTMLIPLIAKRKKERNEPVGISINMVYSTKRKVSRIISELQSPLNQHRICITEAALNSDQFTSKGKPEYRLIYQLANLLDKKDSIPYDDRLDALAGAVSMLASNLGKDHDDYAWLEYRAALQHHQLVTPLIVVQEQPEKPTLGLSRADVEHTL